MSLEIIEHCSCNDWNIWTLK